MEKKLNENSEQDSSESEIRNDSTKKNMLSDSIEFE